jgi:hypothetical protein
MERSRTPLYVLLDRLLPGGIAYWVGFQRGTGKSWRAVAVEIVNVTGIDISHERLRRWFPVEVTDQNGSAA